MSFQLVTGDKRFYVMGIYTPPNCTLGVDNCRVAWEACPADYTPLIVGDLNIWFEDPANDRADVIIDLLEEINTTNLSCNFLPQGCSQQLQWACWNFRMQRGREWCYLQSNYLLGNERINKRLRRVALCLPWYHYSDHQAIVETFWGGRVHWLKSYQLDRQCFPLQLSQGEETEQTKTFNCLVVECFKPELRKRQGND
jgi:hypothetical protein